MSPYIQSWKLDNSQTIHLSKNNKIIFRHRTDNGTKYRGISISIEKLCSIKDFADLTREGVTLKLPIDQQVWIEYKTSVKLYVCSPKRHDIEYRFFRFSDEAWNRFKRSVLPDIISFVKDGAHRTDDCRKPHAITESGRKAKSKRPRTTTSQQKQIDSMWKNVQTIDEFTPRETDNADMEEIEEGEIIDYPILS